MKLAVANNIAGYPRFFDGRWLPTPLPTGFSKPRTTAAPDRAQTYDDRVVAELLADLFNVAHGFETGTVQRPWIVIELPEAWT